MVSGLKVIDTLLSKRVAMKFGLALGVSMAPLMVNEPSTEFKPVLSYRQLDAKVRKQVDCLADNIYFESRGEPVAGQKAVALVTVNRARSGIFPKSVCAVVRQTTSSVCQFSWWCDADARYQVQRRKFAKREYAAAREVAMDVYLNYNLMKDVTKGALFYHAAYVPKTAIGIKGLKRTTKIGQHIFYKV